MRLGKYRLAQIGRPLWGRLMRDGDRSCPPEELLSAWMDDELDAGQAGSIRAHLERCDSCRERALGCQRAFSEIRAEASLHSCFRENDGQTPILDRAPATCLDEETLVAYSEAELSRDEAAQAETHLRGCAHCVGEVQRLVELRVAMEAPRAPSEAPLPSAVVAERAATAAHLGSVVAGWLARLAEWLQSGLSVLARPWPAAGLVAATALALVVIAGLLPRGSSDLRARGAPAPVKFEVVVDAVAAHARPGDDEPIVATLSRGTVVNRLEESKGWTRIELPDGRRVWVRSGAVVARATR